MIVRILDFFITLILILLNVEGFCPPLPFMSFCGCVRTNLSLLISLASLACWWLSFKILKDLKEYWIDNHVKISWSSWIDSKIALAYHFLHPLSLISNLLDPAASEALYFWPFLIWLNFLRKGSKSFLNTFEYTFNVWWNLYFTDNTKRWWNKCFYHQNFCFEI